MIICDECYGLPIEDRVVKNATHEVDTGRDRPKYTTCEEHVAVVIDKLVKRMSSHATLNVYINRLT